MSAPWVGPQIPGTLHPWWSAGYFAQQAWTTLWPNISTRGPKAPKACQGCCRFHLSEFHLSEFHLFLNKIGYLSSDELSLNFVVFLGHLGPPGQMWRSLVFSIIWLIWLFIDFESCWFSFGINCWWFPMFLHYFFEHRFCIELSSMWGWILI